MYFIFQTPSTATTNLGYLPDLRVFVVRGQGQCVVEDAQKLTIRILNCTQRAMNLSVEFNNSIAQQEEFFWIGVIKKQLGKIEAHQLYDIQLELVPLTCGLKVKSKEISIEMRFFFSSSRELVV